jgi:hypothetical protein
MRINLTIENAKELDALIYAMSDGQDMDACRSEFQHDNHLNLGGIRISCDRGGHEMTIDIDSDTLAWLSEKVGRLYFELAEAATKAVIGQAKKMEGWDDHFLAKPVLTVDGCKVESGNDEPCDWPEATCFEKECQGWGEW